MTKRFFSIHYSHKHLVESLSQEFRLKEEHLSERFDLIVAHETEKVHVLLRAHRQQLHQIELEYLNQREKLEIAHLQENHAQVGSVSVLHSLVYLCSQSIKWLILGKFCAFFFLPIYYLCMGGVCFSEVVSHMYLHFTN